MGERWLTGLREFVDEPGVEFGSVDAEEQEAGAGGEELFEDERELRRPAEMDEAGCREIGCLVLSRREGGVPGLRRGDVKKDGFVHYASLIRLEKT